MQYRHFYFHLLHTSNSSLKHHRSCFWFALNFEFLRIFENGNKSGWIDFTVSGLEEEILAEYKNLKDTGSTHLVELSCKIKLRAGKKCGIFDNLSSSLNCWFRTGFSSRHLLSSLGSGRRECQWALWEQIPHETRNENPNSTCDFWLEHWKIFKVGSLSQRRSNDECVRREHR